jgi:hypothetical protein
VALVRHGTDARRRVGARSRRRGRAPPRLAIAYPWIVGAMALHGAFNAMALVLGWAGVAP